MIYILNSKSYQKLILIASLETSSDRRSRCYSRIVGPYTPIYVLFFLPVLYSIFSYFPPSTTIRAYHRATLATTTSEIGAIYCSIISFANSRRERESSQEIVTSLIAIRSKLKRSLILRANVVYEFSLRGKWPSERYHKLLTIQLCVTGLAFLCV